MRREENSRKRKRDEVKERKEREKETRAQELKQLKAMKKKEILDKMDKLKKIAGTEGLNFQVNLQRVYGSLIDWLIIYSRADNVYMVVHLINRKVSVCKKCSNFCSYKKLSSYLVQVGESLFEW